jgi:hypothetical protein
MITLVAVRDDHYGYAAIGIASALATPITGVVAWRTARGRPTRLSRALLTEAAMLIAALVQFVASAAVLCAETRKHFFAPAGGGESA